MLLKPHRLLLILAATLCVAEFIRTLIFGDNIAVDIPLQDTYFVISYFHIALVFALLILGMAFLYKMGDQSQFKYNKWLTLGHFASITLFIITFSKLTLISSIIPKRYYSFSDYDPVENINNNIDFLNKWLLIFALLIVFFFVLNLIVGYLNRKNDV
jgi:heme/copper-type cytochrome/quinol oxidase subunit 1